METISLQSLLMKIQYRISSGCKFKRNCYGKNARKFCFGEEGEEPFGHVVFNDYHSEIYEISYYHGTDEKGTTVSYLWRHPEYKVDYRKESAILRDKGEYSDPTYKQTSLDSVVNGLVAHK